MCQLITLNPAQYFYMHGRPSRRMAPHCFRVARHSAGAELPLLNAAFKDGKEFGQRIHTRPGVLYRSFPLLPASSKDRAITAPHEEPESRPEAFGDGSPARNHRQVRTTSFPRMAAPETRYPPGSRLL